MEDQLNFINYHVDAGRLVLHSSWLRPVDSQEFRMGLLEACSAIESNQIKFWLQDSTLLSPRDVLDQKWITEHLALLLVQCNLKKVAIVNSLSESCQKLQESWREKNRRIFGNMLEIQVFDSTSSAAAWLSPSFAISE